MIAAGGLGGAVSPSPPRVSRVMPSWRDGCKANKQFHFFFFFHIKHTKTVIVRVNIG